MDTETRIGSIVHVLYMDQDGKVLNIRLDSTGSALIDVELIGATPDNRYVCRFHEFTLVKH